ncbi:hypothetical protein MA16_Dca028461 [Dendrobium catenatum]|uniref:Uncharacterized protein n=1 Tax=Dendrobium catenatum TaxID=906689 RepID=A0A2I0V6Z2_9ASPA|nr:hypothetical protein MA16_Dca028461 [Dendrobium catenatum]
MHCNVQPSGGHVGKVDLAQSRSMGSKRLRNWRNPVDSPSQLLVPKVLNFSDNKAKVKKATNKHDRKAKARFIKEVKVFEPLQKLPGVRRSMAADEVLTLSTSDHLVNVIDNSGRERGTSVELGDRAFVYGPDLLNGEKCGRDAVDLCTIPKRNKNEIIP